MDHFINFKAITNELHHNKTDILYHFIDFIKGFETIPMIIVRK